ncbi:Mannose-binding lectin [Penicillium hordei]|uniref:Mannose-binding lectin n=1 Tax=Penicillium hordei TaxID=40994 RepID=A0AAD6GT69_9EURO|nr:Mannose-binding lectin [Penicillium hordei]KAJ5589213.1 Mannose-binding lectin [Penicillium hordei]
MNGPFGGKDGGGYDEQHGKHKVKIIDAWGTKFKTYDVLNGFQFIWDDGHRSNLIGHRNDSNYKGVEFNDGEKITDMTVHAGNGEGYVNGFEFNTNQNRHYSIGGKEGKAFPLKNLGTGYLTGATGGYPNHGCGDVVDSMDIYFLT